MDSQPPVFASLDLWLSCPEPSAFARERLAQSLDADYGAKASLPSHSGPKWVLPLQLPRERVPRLVHDAESGKLDALVRQGGANFVQEICEGNRCLFQHLPRVTFRSPPRFEDVGSADLKRLLPKVDLVLLTTTEIERDALYEVMKPFPGYSGLVEGAIQHNTYRLGRFGRYLAAHVESTMGSQARHGSTLTVHDALAELSPKAVLILGIAFGINPEKQRLGDVIVAETVIPYELQRVGQRTIHRGQPLKCGSILSERFRTRRTDWKLERGEDTVKVFQGPLLSGEKLADNLAFRDELAKAFPTAWGGEMEGAGAYAATERHDVEIILVKAICDWADGSKSDRAQPFAAKAAVSLAHHVLSKRAVLEVLHARDYEPQDGAPVELPQASDTRHPARRSPQVDPAVRALLPLLRQPFSLLLGDYEGKNPPSQDLIEALARRLPPGVHVTLHQWPLLKEALIQHQPGLPLLVIRPSRLNEGAAFITQYGGRQGWRALEELPEVLDLKRSVLLLELDQIYVSDPLLNGSPLAEDDFHVATHGLESLLEPKVVDTLLSALYARPTLVLGLSLSVRGHQLALRHLFGHRPLPRKSTVLLEPGDAEALSWQGGRGLPGGAGLQVIQAEASALATLLGMPEPEKAS